MLHIDLYSFGYHRSGIPADPSGNRGGFVFDCRILPNPGREQRYAGLSGLDAAVGDFLAGRPETTEFLTHVLALIEAAARNYTARGFTHLMVNFGCTGGQHRSVYIAECVAATLRPRGYHVTLTHTERERWQ
ncbi:MAG: RNase adapter RapZ [Bacteroidota bacterium]|jgi:RNase adaptor protein for sRNA GlmZ degradation|nr:RNase adapter RapZ [Bacteroidota bacterium]